MEQLETFEKGLLDMKQNNLSLDKEITHAQQ